jgi:hypothetical protein
MSAFFRDCRVRLHTNAHHVVVPVGQHRDPLLVHTVGVFVGERVQLAHGDSGAHLAQIRQSHCIDCVFQEHVHRVALHRHVSGLHGHPPVHQFHVHGLRRVCQGKAESTSAQSLSQLINVLISIHTVISIKDSMNSKKKH